MSDFLDGEVQINSFSSFKMRNAVQCIHIPSGLKVICHEHRSQHRNKSQALAELKEKVVKQYGCAMSGAT